MSLEINDFETFDVNFFLLRNDNHAYTSVLYIIRAYLFV